MKRRMRAIGRWLCSGRGPDLALFRAANRRPYSWLDTERKGKP